MEAKERVEAAAAAAANANGGTAAAPVAAAANGGAPVAAAYGAAAPAAADDNAAGPINLVNVEAAAARTSAIKVLSWCSDPTNVGDPDQAEDRRHVSREMPFFAMADEGAQ